MQTLDKSVVDILLHILSFQYSSPFQSCRRNQAPPLSDSPITKIFQILENSAISEFITERKQIQQNASKIPGNGFYKIDFQDEKLYTESTAKQERQLS